MAPRVKRARTYGAYRGSRAKVPVAKNVKRYVKRCMDRLVDEKWQDTTLTFNNIASAGVVGAGYFGTIQLGTGDTSRTGNNVRVQKMLIKGHFSDTATGKYRIIVGMDRQCNGAACTASDVLSSVSTNGPYNHDTVVGWGGSRFEILSDVRGELNLQVAATALINRYFFYKNKPYVVRYNGNAGTVSDVVSNNLFLLLVSDNSTVDFTGVLTLMYTDA